MIKIQINIFSQPKDYNLIKNEIEQLLTDNLSIFKITLMRVGTETPENTLIEIEGEFPLYGRILFNICEEYENISFENYSIDNSIVTNKVVITKE